MAAKTKRGAIIFPTQAPTTWVVGRRVGDALRRATGTQGGTHAGPRPHIRRAHWHTYLIGMGRQERVLRWIPPISVAVERGEIIPTIHRVAPTAAADLAIENAILRPKRSGD